jgi:hypothetical protein
MKKELLPIGTVVLLKGGLKKVMITGYFTKTLKADKIYDYNGCIFPEGLMENIYTLFDANQIDKVFYEGLNNKEYVDYVKYIKELYKKKNNKTYKFDFGLSDESKK